MIREEEMSKAQRYDRVIRTRPDLKWLIPHPPLSLFTTDRVWLLNGQHFGGVNNRHVIGSRDSVFKLLDRQRLIFEGDPIIFKMNNWEVHQNDEYYMKVIGDEHQIKWGEMQYPGYLVSNPAWVISGWRRPGAGYAEEYGTALETEKKWRAAANACWVKSDKAYVAVDSCAKQSFIGMRPSSTTGSRLRR